MTLASAAQANYSPIALAPTAISRLFVDQGVPKVQLVNGRQFLLMNLPVDVQRKLVSDVGKAPVHVPLPAYRGDGPHR